VHLPVALSYRPPSATQRARDRARLVENARLTLEHIDAMHAVYAGQGDWITVRRIMEARASWLQRHPFLDQRNPFTPPAPATAESRESSGVVAVSRSTSRATVAAA